MSIFNRTVGSVARDASRLESERSFRTSVVTIEAISPDQTRARCKPVAGSTRSQDTIEVRVILTPGIYYPIDVSNYMGLLHGDPKNPIGVQLIPKAYPRLDTNHGLSTGLFGQSGNKTSTSVNGRAVVATNSIEQYIAEQGHPDGHAVVIKPPKQLPESFVGRNAVYTDDPSSYVDNATAYVSVSEDEVRLVADFGNAMLINKSSGLSIMGKLNIGSSIQDVRIGGAWRFNPMMQFQIPSTAVSPIPTLIYDVPGKNITQGIQSQVDIINSIPGA